MCSLNKSNGNSNHVTSNQGKSKLKGLDFKILPGIISHTVQHDQTSRPESGSLDILNEKIFPPEVEKLRALVYHDFCCIAVLLDRYTRSCETPAGSFHLKCFA